MFVNLWDPSKYLKVECSVAESLRRDTKLDNIFAFCDKEKSRFFIGLKDLHEPAKFLTLGPLGNGDGDCKDSGVWASRAVIDSLKARLRNLITAEQRMNMLAQQELDHMDVLQEGADEFDTVRKLAVDQVQGGVAKERLAHALGIAVPAPRIIVPGSA